MINTGFKNCYSPKTNFGFNQVAGLGAFIDNRAVLGLRSQQHDDMK